ncbi:MAG: hypothetical protein CMP52_01765 [Flavobacteriales bacterium]|jgi:hypothetical protein|nr:hypothetical protein [Candidatus Arcticimaribacter sp.]|tara:strand:- start:1568 stop:1774 length:207 start_codon:yes stop_codon:yes gene_type:complete
MKSFFNKYRPIFILAFLFGFISIIDSFVLNGSFKGIEKYKHFIYLVCLIAGVGFLLFQIIKVEDKNNS